MEIRFNEVCIGYFIIYIVLDLFVFVFLFVFCFFVLMVSGGYYCKMLVYVFCCF